jgi:peptidoglycan/LPS O-acetylase OafA/YrhL
MGIISYFIPFLFMFAAIVRLQREPAGPEVLRVPGGAPVAKLFGVMGFLVSVAAIALACVPADDDPNKTLAVVKIVGGSAVMVIIGAIIYFMGKRRP